MHGYRLIAALACLVFFSSAALIPFANSQTSESPPLLWKLTLPRYVKYYYHDVPQYALPAFASPLVSDNVVYISASGGPDQGMYALKADTGAKIWNYSYENLDDVSLPALAGGVVYINS